MLLSRRSFHSAAVAVLFVLVLSCGTAHDSDEYFVLGYWYTGLMSLLQGRFGRASLGATTHTKPFPVGV